MRDVEIAKTAEIAGQIPLITKTELSPQQISTTRKKCPTFYRQSIPRVYSSKSITRDYRWFCTRIGKYVMILIWC
ncbi:uncharacterized protein PHALS_05090 [Plasmopara halstedii]|uniref:Uncharacterized protein n=1 Tax=Plasmopara halstedii TaxID=4781 RepID=A0A0P1B114_PLAHL|nr:uncharacterized protein PHALS_05090 [Plasmopara halstedii]CEG47753.1 hypothetical protein PHALS_05090 [Plasmopara halstedii]|eukprot:XP_024584122.1 hypothetical protein PHALS_05090 [Plasmopara halstedii]